MIINNYYPTRDALSRLSSSDKQIAEAFDCFAKRTNTTERVKTDTLPVTVFFNCIQTMYDRLKTDVTPRQGINQLWNELNVVIGQNNYYSDNNPRLMTIDFSPKREYEKTILFGGLYAKVKAEPFGEVSNILDAIMEKACYDTIQEGYFKVFEKLDIQPAEVAQSDDEKKVNGLIKKFRSYTNEMSDEEYLDYCESELRIVGNNPNYPEKYVIYIQSCRKEVSKRCTEAALEKKNREVHKQADNGVSFTIKEICDTALKQYDATKGFTDNMESILFDILHRKAVTDAHVFSDFYGNMETLKKRLHPNPSVSIEHNFAPITNNSDGGKSYNMGGGNEEDIRKLIDGKRRR